MLFILFVCSILKVDDWLLVWGLTIHPPTKEDTPFVDMGSLSIQNTLRRQFISFATNSFHISRVNNSLQRSSDIYLLFKYSNLNG